ncbi:uncharacterized protein EMH_0050180 [Eimeria mitis]|uniref:Uncharacterized protein n=1 Tax=Eimeria mitis TaxID=44415 RepID=U6K147_9EIME|nr:uncharacterized protein EMH_0050180 [Eimeria mitis]CDJ29493.1 hypothetical protein EMH_0050180 [Eimeria mitis]
MHWQKGAEMRRLDLTCSAPCWNSCYEANPVYEFASFLLMHELIREAGASRNFTPTDERLAAYELTSYDGTLAGKNLLTYFQQYLSAICPQDRPSGVGAKILGRLITVEETKSATEQATAELRKLKQAKLSMERNIVA